MDEDEILCCGCGEVLETQGRMVWISSFDGSYGHKWCVERYDKQKETDREVKN